MTANEIALTAVKALDSKKGQDIKVIYGVEAYYVNDSIPVVSGSAAASLAAFTVLAALLALFLHWMTKSLVLPSAVFCVLEGGLAAVYFLKPAWLEGLFPKLLNSLALFGRFDNFVNGLFDISSLVYFVSVALLFVFFTCQGFEKRRWS